VGRLFTSLVCLALGLAGCGFDEKAEYFGTTERPGKDTTTFYLNNGNEPEYLDPGLITDTASSTLAEDLFEGLVVRHPKDLHATQGVATHWDQSDDNTVFRFHLRPEARWSDGQPVTAHDFVYAWTRVLTAATGARMAANLYVIKNGTLYHQGKLKVLRRAERLRSKPGASDGDELDKDAALEILEAKDGWAKVRRFTALPTYLPRARDEKPDEQKEDQPAPKKEPAGYVPEDALEADPSVIGVRAKADQILEVELENPTAHFVELVGHTTFFPVRKDVIERFEKEKRLEHWYRPENIVCNGPYTLDEWQVRYQITFKRNPHHYDHDQLKIHRIVWFLVQHYIPTMNLYYAGEIDWIGSNLTLPENFMDLLERYKDFSRAPYLSTYWYDFNLKKKPLDDVRVRKALNLAVDKQLLIDKVTRADQTPATHFVPDFAGSGYAEQSEADKKAGRDPFAGKDRDYDPARARELLAEAGYKLEKKGDGWHAKGFPGLEILYNTSEGHRAVAVAIQSMWQQELGVRVQLRNEEFSVMLKSLRDGQFQVARFGWAADYNHPHTWLETFLSYSGNNWPKWKDKEFDALVEKAAATADPAESIRRYREAELRTVEAMPRMPLYFYTKSTLTKPYVKGYWDNAQNQHHIRYIWIDPDWRNGGENVPAYPPREFPKPGRIAAP
jgi:oligopeptide transport system substrate-binding protein